MEFREDSSNFKFEETVLISSLKETVIHRPQRENIQNSKVLKELRDRLQRERKTVPISSFAVSRQVRDNNNDGN